MAEWWTKNPTVISIFFMNNETKKHCQKCNKIGNVTSEIEYLALNPKIICTQDDRKMKFKS